MIDAHHHIWRQADLPWLLGPEQPRIFGPYAPIKRDYPISEFLADLGGSGIEKSVYVQANWAPNWAADEAAWVQRTSEESGLPHAIVAYADMTVADVRPALDKLARFPLLRGIRQQFHWHENPLYRFAPRPDLAEDETVQRNIARLAAYGWSFDLQLFPSQFAGGARLAAACPEVTFVLQHCGMPEDLSKPGKAAWTKGMKSLAAQPNICVKLSGLGTFLHRNDAAHIAKTVAATVDLFGAERCLFGSNFPIEKIWTSYGDLIAAYQTATKDLPGTARRQIFTDTATRIYRL